MLAFLCFVSLASLMVFFENFIVRNAYVVCRVSSTEKETSIKEAMRAGKKMGMVHIFKNSSGMIGIGLLIHPLEIERQTINRLLSTVELILYLATTQF